MTLGLLLPQSSLYPSLPFDLVEGLRAGLADVGLSDCKLVMEGIEFGTDAGDVQTKAQKLLLQEGADALIGMLPRRVADMLAPMMAQANRLLLVLDVIGEFFAGETPTPHVYYHSLQTCAGAWLAGREAALVGPVIAASSFYDAGYLQGYALSHGVAAGGSHMGGWAVTPLKAADVTLTQLQSLLKQGAGQAVVASYAADMAKQFFSLYEALPQQAPTWGGPMLLDEQMLDSVSALPDGLRGYVAWSRSLANPQNDRFQEALRRRGRHPNLLSLLAYEAASFLPQYLNDLSTLHQLANLTFDSPRGTITMNATTHYSSGPMYAATVTPAENGAAQLTLGTSTPTDDAITHLLAQGQLANYANWFNTYLCI